MVYDILSYEIFTGLWVTDLKFIPWNKSHIQLESTTSFPNNVVIIAPDGTLHKSGLYCSIQGSYM